MKNTNKKVLITGATGGIGHAICEKFLSKKFTLILTSSSNDKIKLLTNKYGKEHYYYNVDFFNLSSIEEFTKEVSNTHKDLTVIVNNAGITEDNLILRMKSEQWERVIQTNLSSNFYIVKSLLPNMLANKFGKIIGISSVVATTGNPGQSNYVASKSGMTGLYKSIASEVAKRNINVNIVSPGFIGTEMTDKLNENQKKLILDRIPMKRLGAPEDIAKAVGFLCSENASYITGQTIHVNGGLALI